MSRPHPEPDLNPPEPVTNHDASDDWKQEREHDLEEREAQRKRYERDERFQRELDRDNLCTKECK